MKAYVLTQYARSSDIFVFWTLENATTRERKKIKSRQRSYVN